MSDAILYFKSRWPDKVIPTDEPAWMYYEVVEATDVVMRTVDVCSDDHSIRNSVKLAEREGFDQREPEHRSLVHGPFLEASGEHLVSITQADFQAVWDRAQDKPWPPVQRNSG